MMMKLITIILVSLYSLTQAAAVSAKKPPSSMPMSELIAHVNKMHQEHRAQKPRISRTHYQEKAEFCSPKVATSIAEQLARLWHSSTAEHDFQQLLNDSLAILREHLTETEIERIVALEPHSPESTALANLFLYNEYIAHNICNAPLFSQIGAFPLLDSSDHAPLLITSDLGGYAALDTTTALHIVNLTTKRITTIPHAPIGLKKREIYFSHDGTALAYIRYPEGADPKTWYKNTVTIYASDSGKRLYGVTNIGASLSASPKKPLFIFMSKHPESKATVLNSYNYTTNTESETALLKEDDVLGNSCIKISPQATYAAFILIDEHTKNTLCIYNTVTKQRFYISTQGIARFLSSPDWHKRLHFTATESAMLLANDNGTIQLFNLQNLRPTTVLQIPELEFYDYTRTKDSPEFSPDGTQLLVPQQGMSAYLYDLMKHKKIKTLVSHRENGPLFAPQNIVTIDIQSCSDQQPCFTFYLPTIDETIKASSSLHFFKQRTKLAYTQPCSNELTIRNLETGAEYTAKKGFYKCVSNDGGTLFCIDRATLTLAQLIIDPASCTLYQLFFLLGIIHTTTTAAEKITSYSQLLRSPILATFSDDARSHVQRFIDDCLLLVEAADSPATAGFSNSSRVLSSATEQKIPCHDA